MNKYEIIKLMKQEYNSIYDEMTDDEIVVLKDILERATPKKVVNREPIGYEDVKFYIGNCPVCGNPVTSESLFCSKDSQALDWSE